MSWMKYDYFVHLSYHIISRCQLILKSYKLFMLNHRNTPIATFKSCLEKESPKYVNLPTKNTTTHWKTKILLFWKKLHSIKKDSTRCISSLMRLQEKIIKNLNTKVKSRISLNNPIIIKTKSSKIKIKLIMPNRELQTRRLPTICSVHFFNLNFKR